MTTTADRQSTASTTGEFTKNVESGRDTPADATQQYSSSEGEDAPQPPIADAADGKDGAVPPLVDDNDGKPKRSKGKIALIMFALCMAVFLAAVDVTIITTALPSISEHFQSSAGYTWIGSAYLLGNAASTPLWGKLSDIWGRKPILLIANAVFFVGSLIAAIAVNIGMLIVGRAIQGVGGGGLVILVNIAIGDLFSMRDRSVYYGIIGGVWAVASALGPIVGGAFAQYVTWRWCFYINLPLDGIAFLIIFFFLDLQTPTTPFWDGIKAIDWLGALLIIGGTVMLLLGLEFGGITYPWNSATTLCLIIFGVFTIVLFALNEWKLAKSPIIPLRLFKKMSNLAALGACFSHGTVFVAGSYFLPLYFQVVLGASPLMSGVYYLPTVLSLSVASMIVGIVIRKTGQYLPPIYLGFLFMTLGTGLFIDLTPTSGWAKIIIYQILAGLGIGPNFQSPLIALQSGIKPRDLASATATFGFVRNLATAISVVVGTVLFQNGVQSRVPTLTSALGPSLANQLGGANAVANVGVSNGLAEPGRGVARGVFADALSEMWILYTVFAFLGLVSTGFIRRHVLGREHEEGKQGLEGERERREELMRERAEKAKRGSRGGAVGGEGVGDEKV